MNMLDNIILSFISKKEYNKLLRSAINDNDLVILKKIVTRKRFRKNYVRENIIDIIYQCIRENKYDAIKIMIDNNESYFLDTFYLYARDIITYSISMCCYGIDICMYLYNFFRMKQLEKWEYFSILSRSIEIYDNSENNKKIFEFLYNEISDIEYDHFYIMKVCANSNKIKIFEKYLDNDRFKVFSQFDEYISPLFEYLVKNGYDDYLIKLMNTVNYDVGKNKNDLLVYSLYRHNDSTTMILLNNKNVIDRYHRPSLQGIFLECVNIHNSNNNRIPTIKKLLELDFIDISYNNNQALIKAIYRNNYEMTKFLLDNRKIDLSKCNDDFKIINDVVEYKLLMLLINIPQFRKYLRKTKDDIIKPIYTNKKIIRTLDE